MEKILILKKISPTKSLYLVLQTNKFICGITTQKKGEIVYIEGVDTTGMFNPREDQKHVTRSLIDLVIKESGCSLVSLFCRPKRSILFGKSEKNSKKGFLDKIKLRNYWIDTLRPFGEINVFSNFYDKKSFPFENLEDVKFFKDDPKFKHFKNVGKVDLKTFCDTLLLRTDFNDGALIYCSVKCVDVPLPVNSTTKSIDEAVFLLRKLNFSNEELCQKSTFAFLKRFKFNFEDFEWKKYEKELEVVPIRFLNIKKK